MLGAYQTSVRHTTSGSSLPGLPKGQLPMKRSLSTRLVFDDTCAEDEEESRVPSKITRLGSDPFSSSLGTKRFPSANSGALTQIQEENESLQGQLKGVKAELAGAVAATAAMENKLFKA